MEQQSNTSSGVEHGGSFCVVKELVQFRYVLELNLGAASEGCEDGGGGEELQDMTQRSSVSFLNKAFDNTGAEPETFDICPELQYLGNLIRVVNISLDDETAAEWVVTVRTGSRRRVLKGHTGPRGR